MKFVARLRNQDKSIIVTIPNEVVEGLELKMGDIASLDIEPIKKEDD